MNIQLLAIAPEERRAVFKRNGETLLVRPPYKKKDLVPVEEATIEKAVSQHGYEAAEGHFEGWDEFISYVRERVLEARTAAGQEEPDVDDFQKAIRLVPTHVIKQYLVRIESELLPARKYHAAVNVLAEMLRAEAVQDDTELHGDVVDMLERCKQLRTVNSFNGPA